MGAQTGLVYSRKEGYFSRIHVAKFTLEPNVMYTQFWAYSSMQRSSVFIDLHLRLWIIYDEKQTVSRLKSLVDNYPGYLMDLQSMIPDSVRYRIPTTIL